MYFILEEQKILETIEKYISQNKNVLIHCNMGQQRSCAVCACFIIKYSRLSMDNVIENIKIKRPMAFFGAINFEDTIIKYYDYLDSLDSLD
jgi:protein-tyrosine phosphatase